MSGDESGCYSLTITWRNQSCPQFIGSGAVACEFRMARWRSESEKSAVARDWWLSPWRGHRRSPDMHKVSYCDVVNHRGMWHPVTKWLTPTSLSELIVIQAWYGGRSRIVTGVHPRRVISYPYE